MQQSIIYYDLRNHPIMVRQNIQKIKKSNRILH